jgi:hypothetical protein
MLTNTDVIRNIDFEAMFIKYGWSVDNLDEVIRALQSARSAYWYTLDTFVGRWPEAEPIIVQDAEFSYLYACDIIRGRWPEAEPVIVQSTSWACMYASHILKCRWLEAEPVIAQDAYYAFLYARDVMKCRWYAEGIIMFSKFADKYNRTFECGWDFV